MKNKNSIVNNPFKSRSDVQEAVLQLCKPLEPYFSEGGAQIILGHTGSGCNERSARMEAFARPLWGLSPLFAGGQTTELWVHFLRGIKNGTNPEHEEYWGNVNHCDQKMVEMAAIGLTLALAPEQVWTPLSDVEKNNFSNWMDLINHKSICDNNWRFFLVLSNLGLKRVGAPYNAEAMERELDRLNEFYLADGWYSDGISEQRDYYIPFAMHFYSLIYAKLMENDDPVRSQLFKDRAAEFAKDFIYWFAEDGAALPYGRSLTYRFAQAAFWGALPYAGVEVFSWGVVKGLLLRNLRWWFGQPIFTNEGILTIGYAYPNLLMAEGYNAPGSPYWGMKAFLPLALEENHPFWLAEELPLPQLEATSVQQHPHMVLKRHENHLAAFTAGQYAAFEPANMAAKYEKFVYSNLFGFSVSKGVYGLGQGAYDSMLALSEGDNLFKVRRKCEAFEVQEKVIYSKWKPWQDVEVETWVIPGLPWHVRIHKIKTNRCIDTAEGGFAIEREHNLVEPLASCFINEDSVSLARFSWGVSGIVDLLGERQPEMVRVEANTNILVQRTVIPTLRSSLQPGVHYLVAAVYGDKSEALFDQEWVNLPKVSIVEGKITVSFNNGLAVEIVEK